jgi:hypothetical protein
MSMLTSKDFDDIVTGTGPPSGIMTLSMQGTVTM